MLQIDSHLHVWDLTRLHYHWLTPNDPLLYRSVLPGEIAPQMRDAGIEGAILVEATNLTSEIPYLHQLTQQHSWIAGIVGWMSSSDQIDPCPYPKLRGARIPAVTADNSPTLPETIAQYELVCELNTNPGGYPHAIQLIQSHPQTIFVLDHFAGAQITPPNPRGWREAVSPFAALPNVAIKVAGYLTAAIEPLTISTLRAYVEAAADLFGVQRLMYGSDYPICTRSRTYEQTADLLREAIIHLSQNEQAQIMGGTAIRIYGLSI